VKVRIIPSTHDGNQQLLTSYVINETLAVDAGALAIGLSTEEQLKLRGIVITHTHLDHIFSLPFMLLNLWEDVKEPIQLFATAADFAALKRYIFNSRVWVSFDVLKNDNGPFVVHRKYRAGESFEVDGLKLTALPVSHTVLTHGILIEDDEVAVLFTSDTGATTHIWKTANSCDKLKAVFIDLSFPNRLTELAKVSRHHSPETLREEISKVRSDIQIFGVHLKVPYRERIVEEIVALNEPRIQVAEIGRTYEF